MVFRKVLFGPPNPIVPPPWQTKDDRIRGGASQSYLSPIEDTTSARFHGHLDTSTLRGAGFASQFSPTDAPSLHSSSISATKEGQFQHNEDNFWRLAKYDGIELVLGQEADNKEYTFILRDQLEQEKRDDGRDKAGISWEIKFNAADCNFVVQGDDDDDSSCKRLFLPWSEFIPTYRGKEIDHPEELKKDQIRRVGIMMRSYFGKQDGDFSLVIHSISAVQASAPPPKGPWFPPCVAKLWALMAKKS